MGQQPDSDVRSGWVSDFGAELARLHRARGLSLHALARMSHYDVGYLSKVVNGHKRGSRELALDLDGHLAADGALLAVWEQSARPPIPVVPIASPAPDADLCDRIARAVSEPWHADLPVVGWFEHTLAEHRRVNDLVGARPLIGPIHSQLRVVAEFTRTARGDLAGSLADLTAQYAQFLAWLCIENHDHAAATAWYDRARDWAEEAGNPDMAATTLSMKAHLAWSLGNPRRCVCMAQAARWYDKRITPGMQGMAAQMEARGHALAGDADLAYRQLDQAQHLISRAAGKPEDEPPWMYFFDENWFRLQRGMAELHLENWPTAVELLTGGLTALPESYRRDRAWYGACLARAHAGAGNAEQSEIIAISYAPDIAAVNSYARGDLLGTARTLSTAGAPKAARVIREALAEQRI
jgi:hypothetical protein